MDDFHDLVSRGKFDYDGETEETTAAESLYGYEGFDARECVKTFNTMVNKGERATLCMYDVAVIAVVYLTRGTNLRSMRGTVSRADRFMLFKLITTYGLRSGKQPVDVLSLARVSLTFATVTVTVAMYFKDHLPVPNSEMSRVVRDYPAAMMTTAFAGLIPQGMAYTEIIRDAHYLYLGELFNRIDARLRLAPNWYVFESFAAHASALQESYPLDQTQRVALMEEWGILVGGVCSEAVIKAAMLFREDYVRPVHV
ncbi:uncharacterized protein LOC125759210 [Rhipicephalus sanguineus]|uniref:Nucleoprotein n=1 Tax=Rhipicephalus sanguineus TaxID=34632 RepID=A0A9D4SRM6_RHISA|nr:uncharacterized protein LOC125759210 [Rhipicephalus sanguineus]KAH7943076.1 hypothetical protein HPB52_004893 [Rhipicephalus sanguineus]